MNEQLIQAIQAVVKTNGRQAITGENLQGVLIDIVRGLGKYPTFAGIVYPDEQEVELTAETETGEKMEIEQDANVFYLAFAEGQYSDFGVELDGEFYHIFRRTSDGWEDVNTYIFTPMVVEKAVQEVFDNLRQISDNFKNYSTIDQMATAISDAIAAALTEYSTTEQMNTALTQAVNNAQTWVTNTLLSYVKKTELTQTLQPYATTEAMTTAIENALENYYTKDEVNEFVSEMDDYLAESFSSLTTYAGMATFDTTPPDNALTKLFYHANRPGYYPGFDVTLEHQGLYAISNESGSWVATLLVLGEVPIDYSREYFHIEALEDDTTISFPKNVEYSNDKTSWSSLAANTNTPTMARGDKLYFKSAATSTIGNISVSKKFNAAGNIMSLVNGDDFIGVETIRYIYIFSSLFENSSIVDASNLKLPATTLASYCYQEMFKDCTSLTQAPELPATTSKNGCYSHMFQGCTSLTQAPELPATTLASDCYENMFQGCTSLTQAPELPATTLASDCYIAMFMDCTSLTQAPELPATILASYCYASMFRRTSLTQAPELPATTLASYCYLQMFQGCTSLTQAPELPATILGYNCYQEMFKDCTSLTQAPELPATTSKNGCYSQMFYNCTSLMRIVMLATDLSAGGLTDWVNGVAASGTFVKAAGVNIPIGTSGIPDGWTVEERAVA